MKEYGYGVMPRVEQMLTSNLSPGISIVQHEGPYAFH